MPINPSAEFLERLAIMTAKKESPLPTASFNLSVNGNAFGARRRVAWVPKSTPSKNADATTTNAVAETTMAPVPAATAEVQQPKPSVLSALEKRELLKAEAEARLKAEREAAREKRLQEARSWNPLWRKSNDKKDGAGDDSDSEDEQEPVPLTPPPPAATTKKSKKRKPIDIDELYQDLIVNFANNPYQRSRPPTENVRELLIKMKKEHLITGPKVPARAPAGFGKKKKKSRSRSPPFKENEPTYVRTYNGELDSVKALKPCSPSPPSNGGSPAASKKNSPEGFQLTAPVRMRLRSDDRKVSTPEPSSDSGGDTSFPNDFHLLRTTNKEQYEKMMESRAEWNWEGLKSKFKTKVEPMEEEDGDEVILSPGELASRILRIRYHELIHRLARKKKRQAEGEDGDGCIEEEDLAVIEAVVRSGSDNLGGQVQWAQPRILLRLSRKPVQPKVHGRGRRPAREWEVIGSTVADEADRMAGLMADEDDWYRDYKERNRRQC